MFARFLFMNNYFSKAVFARYGKSLSVCFINSFVELLNEKIKCENTYKNIDILDNRVYTVIEDARYSRIGGVLMPRAKFQTLTEQMFYILLCLKNECYGMDILDKVPAMTNGRVNVGSGTLYNLLEQFLEEGFIIETKVEGRRRSYLITQKGKEMLDKECERLAAQLADYNSIFIEGDL